MVSSDLVGFIDARDERGRMKLKKRDGGSLLLLVNVRRTSQVHAN
jgi:hypothetical protein